MKIGILSDTHGVFREEWGSYLKGCDYLIHAGDVHTKECYETIKALGIPLYLVRGNNDIGRWAKYLPEFLQVSIGGKIFFIIHDEMELTADVTQADFVIFGHTHHFTTYERGKTVFINPGSTTQGRGDSRSLVLLTLTENDYQLRRILLS